METKNNFAPKKKLYNFFTHIVIFIFATSLFTLEGCASNKIKKTSHNKQKYGRYSQKHDKYPKASSIPSLKHVKNALPKKEPKSRCGNPKSYVVLNKRYQVLDTSKGYKKRGIASFYGTKFHGHKTSNGETYNMYEMSAAHKSLPIPTYAQVTNLKNGKKIIVRINDRGPFHGNRIIDLSYAAAYKLGMLGVGTANVEVKAIDPNNWKGNKLRRKRFNKHTNKVIAEQEVQKQNKNLNTLSLSSNAQPSLSTNTHLQMGAFSNKNNAESLAEKIKNVTEHPVYISETQNNSGKIYRVNVGPIHNENIQSLKEKFKSENLPNPITLGLSSN